MYRLKRVVIQAAAPSRASLGRLVCALRDSGIEPTIVGPRAYSLEHFLDSLRALRDSDPFALGLRLEEDAIVSSHHLRHNVETWRVYSQPDFGSGWLFESEHSRRGRRSNHEAVRGRDGELHFRSTEPQKVGSVAVVLRSRDVTEELLGAISDRWGSCQKQQDRALSLALWDMGKRIYLHDPPIVDHDIRERSVLAPDRDPDPILHSAGMFFDPTFRRALPVMPRVVIMCAGDGERWGNYLGVPKYLVRVGDEMLLQRTLRLLGQAGVTDIWMTAKTPVKITGVKGIFVRKEGLEDRFTNALYVWDTNKDIVYLYGDVYYTEKAMNTILETTGDFRAFGRPGASTTTGKPHGEVFAIRFSDKKLAGDALTAMRNACMRGATRSLVGWTWYRQVEGAPLEQPFIGDRFVVIDDRTEDFDCPEDYERWIARA